MLCRQFLVRFTCALLFGWMVCHAAVIWAAEGARTEVAAPDGEGARGSAADVEWPLFRGNPQASGVAIGGLPESMELLWSYRVEKGGFEATPVIAAGYVYLPDLDGTVHVLRLDNGQVVWKKDFSLSDKIRTGFMASAAVRANSVYVCDMDGKVSCLDVQDGRELWSFQTDAEIDASVNFFQDRILVGSQDAHLYCLDGSSGKLHWQLKIDDQIRCSATIADRYCFVAGCDGQFHIMDALEGKETAKVPIEDPTGVTPAVQGDYVYFGTQGGKFFCIDWKKGSVAWARRATAGQQPFNGSPAVSGETVVVAGRDKRVRALHAETGDEIWQVTTKAGIDSSPVIVDNHVVVGGGDGRVYRFDLANGNIVWQYEAGGKFAASPAVAARRLVVANDTGTVFCFGAK